MQRLSTESSIVSKRLSASLVFVSSALYSFCICVSRCKDFHNALPVGSIVGTLSELSIMLRRTEVKWCTGRAGSWRDFARGEQDTEKKTGDRRCPASSFLCPILTHFFVLSAIAHLEMLQLCRNYIIVLSQTDSVLQQNYARIRYHWHQNDGLLAVKWKKEIKEKGLTQVACL